MSGSGRALIHPQGIQVEIVGIDESNRGRSCSNHHCCGSILAEATAIPTDPKNPKTVMNNVNKTNQQPHILLHPILLQHYLKFLIKKKQIETSRKYFKL